MQAKINQVNCDYLSQHLDLPIDVEIYDFTMKSDDNHVGYDIAGFEYIKLTIYWRVAKADITWIDEWNLKQKHNGVEIGNYIDGEFNIFTKDSDGDYDVIFPENVENAAFDVYVDFLNNKIEVI